MKEEEKSKYKFNIIISLIGIVISIICMIYEIFISKSFPMFWIIIFSCNIVILIGNIYEYKKINK